jgi:pyruvate formate lyase activating enzyme
MVDRKKARGEKEMGTLDSSLDALVLNIQRLSTEDGPGIRTTVFFKGCPLHCAWCHNPESISQSPQLQWFAGRCIGCGTCVETCVHGVLALTEDGVTIDRDRCIGCGDCAAACPTNALELLGTRITLQELLDEVLRDRAFYNASGGGVTVSGGEPTRQVGFLETFLRELKAEGIHTALDTCGLCSWNSLERLLPHLDLILFDVKAVDADLHRQHTGQDNRLILENFQRLLDTPQVRSSELEIWVRTPLIPGATADEEVIAAAGSYLCEHAAHGLARWELCAFNNLCQSQYERLGMDWRYAGIPLLDQGMISSLERTAREFGPQGLFIQATGPARTD